MGLPYKWRAVDPERLIVLLTGTHVDIQIMALVEQSGHNQWQFPSRQIVAPVTTPMLVIVGLKLTTKCDLCYTLRWPATDNSLGPWGTSGCV